MTKVLMSSLKKLLPNQEVAAPAKKPAMKKTVKKPIAKKPASMNSKIMNLTESITDRQQKVNDSILKFDKNILKFCNSDKPVGKNGAILCDFFKGGKTVFKHRKAASSKIKGGELTADMTIRAVPRKDVNMDEFFKGVDIVAKNLGYHDTPVVKRQKADALITFGFVLGGTLDGVSS